MMRGFSKFLKNTNLRLNYFSFFGQSNSGSVRLDGEHVLSFTAAFLLDLALDFDWAIVRNKYDNYSSNTLSLLEGKDLPQSASDQLSCPFRIRLSPQHDAAAAVFHRGCHLYFWKGHNFRGVSVVTFKGNRVAPVFI